LLLAKLIDWTVYTAARYKTKLGWHPIEELWDEYRQESDETDRRSDALPAVIWRVSSKGRSFTVLCNASQRRWGGHE